MKTSFFHISYMIVNTHMCCFDIIYIFTVFYTSVLYRYATQYLDTHLNLPPHSRAHQWRDVNRLEMKAFIGLWMTMGVIKKSTIASYWSSNSTTWLINSPSFSQAYFILCVLHLNWFKKYFIYKHIIYKLYIVSGYNPSFILPLSKM